MDVSYDYYRVFYHVARCGSISRAAELLGSNQPNVTKLMNKLEDQLGCKLLLRSNRGVRLTAQGEKLFAHVEVAFRQLQQAEQELSGLGDLASGIVRIGATETALHGLLLPVLADFHRQYPGVRLMIANFSTPQAVAALKRGSVDFAMVTTPTDAPMDLRQTELMEFREVLVSAAPEPRPLSLQELVSRPIVGLGRHTKTYDFYAQLLRSHRLEWRPDIDAATVDQILPLVKAGLGMGFLPEFLAREPLSQGTLHQVSLTTPIPTRRIVLLESPAQPHPPAAARLRQLLTEGRGR